MRRGSIMRYPPPPVVSAAPKLWKSLGVLVQDHTGYVEGHYALDTFRGDYDVDTEAELREAARSLYTTLARSGYVDPDAHYILQNSRFAPRVRLATELWGEPNVIGGKQ